MEDLGILSLHSSLCLYNPSPSQIPHEPIIRERSAPLYRLGLCKNYAHVGALLRQSLVDRNGAPANELL